MEVSDMLGLGVEDLGLNWELQPWWALEPRPRYEPRPHEPHPARLRSTAAAAAAAAARERQERAAKRAARRRQQQQQRAGLQQGQGQEAGGGDLLICLSSASSSSSSDEREPGHDAAATAAAVVGATRPPPSYMPYIEPPARVLAAKAATEHMALLHYDVAQLHARAKFADFLGAVPLPYGLYGEERRRELEVYEHAVYAEAFA